MLVIAVVANPTSLDLAVANCPGTSLLVVPVASEGVAVCRDFHDVTSVGFLGPARVTFAVCDGILHADTADLAGSLPHAKSRPEEIKTDISRPALLLLLKD